MENYQKCPKCSRPNYGCPVCGNKTWCDFCGTCVLSPEHTRARKAIDELKELGAPVYDHLAGENGANFIIGAELRNSEDRYFADYYGEEIREYIDDNGAVINAFGVRQDVIDILDHNNLRSEWINPAQLGVYDD